MIRPILDWDGDKGENLKKFKFIAFLELPAKIQVLLSLDAVRLGKYTTEGRAFEIGCTTLVQ